MQINIMKATDCLDWRDGEDIYDNMDLEQLMGFKQFITKYLNDESLRVHKLEAEEHPSSRQSGRLTRAHERVKVLELHYDRIEDMESDINAWSASGYSGT